MNANEYQELAGRTECDQMVAATNRILHDGQDGHKYLATRLCHAALGLSEEVGEFAYAIEKWIQYGQELDESNLVEEIGDILWYVALACNALDIRMESAMIRNIRKLRARYPEKYTKECAVEENRDRVAEQEAANDYVCEEAIEEIRQSRLNREAEQEAADDVVGEEAVAGLKRYIKTGVQMLPVTAESDQKYMVIRWHNPGRGFSRFEMRQIGQEDSRWKVIATNLSFMGACKERDAQRLKEGE